MNLTSDETANHIAQNMLVSNVSIDLVAQFKGLTLKQVQKLQKQITEPLKTTKSTSTKR